MQGSETIYSFEDLLYAYVMKTITFCNSAFPSDATYFLLSHYSVNPEAFLKKKHEWKLSRRETCDCNFLDICKGSNLTFVFFKNRKKLKKIKIVHEQKKFLFMYM